jgi:tRNA A37 N6-isopentenylltransferase MiaA
MNAAETDIIIIKGAPASGKSQTAKELSKFFPKGVRMEVDNLRSMVISVDWTNQTEHINILNISTKLIFEFFNLGFKPVIIIDTFSGDKIDSYYEKLKELNNKWIIGVFGLFLAESELKNRLDERTDEKFKDFSISKKLNEDIINFKHKEEYQIDTTNLEPKDTAKIIFEKLKKENTCKHTME